MGQQAGRQRWSSRAVSWRAHAVLLIAVFTLALSGVLYLVASRILLTRADAADAEIAAREVGRLQVAVEELGEALERIAGDYSDWDQTFGYVARPNPAYVAENLSDNLPSLDIDLVVLARADGTVLTVRPEPRTAQERAWARSLIALVTDPRWRRRALRQPVRGLVAQGDRPALVSLRPVLTTAHRGPALGVQLMARALDEPAVRHFSRLLRLPVVLHLRDDPLLTGAWREARARLAAHPGVTTLTVDAGHLAGYTTLLDLEGQPRVLAGVELPRQIYAETRQSGRLLLVSLLLVGLVFAAVTVRIYGGLLQTQLARERMEERHRALVASSADAVIITDREGRICVCNEPAAQLFGRSAGELVGLRANELVPPEDAARLREAVEQGGGRASGLELVIHRGDGALVPVEVSLARLLDDTGGRAGHVGIFRDVTERRIAAASLRHRVEMEQLVARLAGGFVSVDGTTIDVRVDAALAALGQFLQVDRVYLFALTDGRISNTHEWCGPGISSEIGHLQGIAASTIPWWMARLEADGLIHVPSVAALPAEAENERAGLQAQGIQSLVAVATRWQGEVTGFVGFDSVRCERTWSEADFALLRVAAEVVSSALARQATEDALEDERQRIGALIDHVSDLLLVVDRDGGCAFASPSAERVLGLAPESLVGMAFPSLVHPEDRGMATGHLAAAWTTGRLATTLLRLRHQDGSWRMVECEGRLSAPGSPLTGLILAGRDITGRRTLEEQLRQAQKMEAVGQLAGGIAHDFNNVLAAILGYAELLRESGGADDDSREFIQQILTATDRGAGLVRQLLAFSRRQEITLQRLDLNEVATGTRQMLERLIREDIELSLALDPRPAMVEVDRGQVEQILLNLAVNARDAMPRGGVLRIATRHETCRPSAPPVPDLPPGHYVVLSVIDTGCGMDEATRSRIFEPFFTTKGVGKGTGLGLATVYGIVTQSSGRIRVDSAPGRGTTFDIYLPAVGVVARARPGLAVVA